MYIHRHTWFLSLSPCVCVVCMCVCSGMTAGLTLMGFKPRSKFKRHYYVKLASFIYPDEQVICMGVRRERVCGREERESVGVRRESV